MKHIKTLNGATLKNIAAKRRLRRMPDFLPVCLQDLLHRCKSRSAKISSNLFL